MRRLVEGRQRNAFLAGELRGALGSRDADDVEAGAHALAEAADEMDGRRASADAELHAALDMLQRRQRSLPLEIVGVGHSSPSPRGPRPAGAVC